MANILVCDDDKDIVEAIEIYLTQEGYHILKAYDGQEALDILNSETVDLLIIDVMMPRLDGIRATVKIRESNPLPIIILSAKSEDTDKILGLNIGADDYITKPFAIEELLARLRANFRRQDREVQKRKKTDGTTFRDLIINKKNRQVQRGEEIIDLTKREYDLLTTLMKNVNDVVTREQLVQNVWGYEEGTETNVVDVYIRYLRNKLDQKGKDSYIQTVRGLGYMLRENN